MTLERYAIRKRIVESLIGQTQAQNRVYASRARNLQSENLPAILVYVSDEDASIFEQAPRRYKVTAKVVIQIAARGDEDLDAFLDSITEKVWRVLSADMQLQGVDGVKGENKDAAVAADCRFTGTSSMIDDQGDQLIGWHHIMLDVDYYKYSPDETVNNVSDFEVVDLQWDIAPADGRVEAEDQLRLS